MKDEQLKRRVAAAKLLAKKLQTIQKSLNKIPSFTGKARFMDKVIYAARDAYVLSENLELDLAYRKKSN